MNEFSRNDFMNAGEEVKKFPNKISNERNKVSTIF